MEAVDQGNFVAEQERRRLRLGHTRIVDMAKLVNDQGIWASGAHLPIDMSGLFLRHPEIGMFILVNFGHVRARKRFSYAHEYAHALVDRSRTATVSLDGNRADLGEVRANAFAAAFLMPSGGVWEFLNARQKGRPSRAELPVYDPLLEQTGQPGVHAQRRSTPSSQELTFEDIAALAHHFGVSYQAALYRLKSLAVLTDRQFEALRQKEPFGRDYLRLLEMLDDLEGREESKPDREIVSQVLHLALEGYRREEISQGKLRDLSVLLDIPAHEILALADAT
jgi:Zn-dependent peptidase ImmA (M78 family)